LGFSGESQTGGLPYDKLKERVTGELKKLFRPEFLNRVDEVIVFHELTAEEIHAIVDLMIAQLRDQLLNHGIGIVLADAGRDFLAQEGFDPQLGARPLRRAIQRFVEDPLSEQILAGQWSSGDVIEVDASDCGIAFNKSDIPVSSFEHKTEEEPSADDRLMPPPAPGGGGGGGTTGGAMHSS
jgi:ATP-dependent Clp protease ATP-binding subunit ClpC